MRGPPLARGGASSSRVTCCFVDTMASCQAGLLPAYATGVITERVQGHSLALTGAEVIRPQHSPRFHLDDLAEVSSSLYRALGEHQHHRVCASSGTPQGCANCHPPAPTTHEGIEMTSLWTAIAADILSITVLAYAVYYRRYFRRDLVLAFVALNVGVLSVTMLLTEGSASLGLGLGLFGILSIIRLRSDAITQEEVAYYFISLAMGLVSGLHPNPFWLSPALAVMLVVVMYLADHPRFARKTFRQTVTLDVAHPNVETLKAALEALLGAKVLHVVVQELDLVRDLTVVDVRYRVLPAVADHAEEPQSSLLSEAEEIWAAAG